jgi:hypothetical protein
MAPVTLIVMEAGSAWPGHVGDFESVVAVGGAGHGLLKKTLEKLDSLRRGGQRVRVAVLACNDTADRESTSRRVEIAHELLSSVVAVSFGRLVLSCRDGISVQQRRDLVSLAGALVERVRGRTATVSVKFGGRDAREVGRADGLAVETI